MEALSTGLLRAHDLTTLQSSFSLSVPSPHKKEEGDKIALPFRHSAHSQPVSHRVLKRALGRGSLLTTYGKHPKPQTLKYKQTWFTPIPCQVLAVQT